MKATKPKSLFAKAAKFALAALLGASIAIIGCKNDSGGGNEEEDPPPGKDDIELVSISIADADDDTVEVEKDDEIKLVVIFNPTNATNKTLKWSPSNDKLSVTPSDDTYTATIKGLQEGDTTITVTPVANEALAKTVTVKVVPPSTVELGAITFDKNDETIAPGETLTVKATAIATDSSGETPPEVTYTWTTTSEDIELSGTETDTVTITAKSTAKAGSVTVDVHAKAGTKNRYGTYKLTIEKATVGDDDPNYPYTLYSEDFSSVTDATTVFTSTNAAAALTIKNDNPVNATSGNYLQFMDTSGNGRNATLKEDLLTLPTSGKYVVAWDASLYYEGNYPRQIDLYTTTPTVNSGASDYLFSIVVPTAGWGTVSDKLACTINGKTVSSVELTVGCGRDGSVKSSAWYHYKLAVDIDNKTASITITDAEGDSVLEETELDVKGDSYILKGINISSRNQFASPTCIDNIVVKSATNVVTIKNSSVTSSATDGTIDAKGEATFTATADAEDTEKQSVTPTYAWSLGEGDEGFATLSATTGETVTVTGTNTTTKNHTVTVICTVTAGGTTKKIPTSLTVKADASLLTDIGFADTNKTEVEAGEKITLTTTGGEAAEGIESKVELAWTSNKTGVATVTKTGEVEGIGEGAATITVTATLDDIVKSAAWDITVTPSKKPLERVTVTPEKGELATGGRTIMFTASTNDRVVPDTWKVTAEPSNVVDIAFDEKEKTDTLPVTVTSKDTTGSVTITVTATKAGDEPAEATYTLTLRAPKLETLYNQDFEDGKTDWTTRGDGSPAKIVVQKDDATTNPNPSNYIYVIGGHSGDTSAEKAVSSSVDGTTVEFDLKFDGTATNGTLDFALLGARSTLNYLSSDKRILVIESSKPGTNGHLKDFTINGTNYFDGNFVANGETGETTTNGNNQNLNRGSTGWLHVKAVLNFMAQTIDIKVTKIADGSVILEESDLAFLDSNVPSLEYFFVNGGKQYGGTCLDNIIVTAYN